jgi:hypothetical protein
MGEIHAPHRNELTLLVAHRGLHAVLGQSEYADTPENSLQAIRNAAIRCFEMVEIDLRMTKDGVPVLSHDFRWGREVQAWHNNVCCYDPFANQGYNPQVKDLYYNAITTFRLRNSVNFGSSPFDERPPSLVEVLRHHKSQAIEMVLAIDVKDEAALKAAWWAVVQEGMTDKVLFKFSAATFPKPSLFQAAMSTQWKCNNCGTPDWEFMHFMPVYNTGDVAPYNSFGDSPGEEKLRKSVMWYKDNRAAGIEINIKDFGKILPDTMTESAFRGRNVTTAIFNPYREFTGWGKNHYFYSDGHCCAELSEYYFNKNGTEWPGGPRDTIDRRTQWDFIGQHVSQGWVSMITSDNVLGLEPQLAAMGRRNTLKYLR